MINKNVSEDIAYKMVKAMCEKRDDIVAIDTGCLWGGKLTAVRFPDRRIYQEDCPCWADPFKYK